MDNMDNNKSTSVKLNILFNGILNIANYAFPVIAMMYVSRVLEPSGIGKVSFATSVVSYFTLFAQMGIPIYGMRKVAECRNDNKQLNKNVIEIFMLGMYLWLIVNAIYIVFVGFVPKFRSEYRLYIIVGSSILFQSIGFEWFFKGIENYKYIMTRSIIMKLVSMFLMIFLIKNPEDYLLYGGINVLANGGAYLCNLFSLHKYVSLRMDKKELYKPFSHMRMVVTFFVMSCAGVIYGNIDNVMLGFMRGDEAVGYYYIAVKLCAIVTSITAVIWNVTLPKSTRLWNDGKIEEFDGMSRKSMNLVCYIQIPLTGFFVIMADKFIEILAGGGYENSVFAARILFITILPIGFSNIIGGQMLIPMKLEKKLLIAQVTGAVVNLITNIFAINYYGIYGAAATTVISEILVWVVAQYYVKKVHRAKLFEFENIYKNIIGSAIALVVVYGILQLKLSLVIMTIVAACVFFVIYFVVTFLLKDSTACLLWNTLFRRINNDKEIY